MPPAAPRFSVALRCRSFSGAALAALALALSACAGDDPEAPPPAPPPDLAFAEVGSLAAPEGAGSFRFGAASAATQIEDQNPTTDWYLFTRPESEGGLGKGKDFVGDASGGYTRALEDVALLQNLGLDSYRFSIEWARIEPQRDVIDEEALAHYENFIDSLVAAGIRPVVTLHHFSNPVWVHDPRDVACEAGVSDQNLCGFGHPEGGPQVIEEMAEHAALMAERFGDRVDEWGTLNEPVNYILASYGIGSFPPGKSTILNLLEEFVPAVRDYLRAHAAMYHAVKAADLADADGDGRPADVGLSLSVAEWVPARGNQVSENPEDVGARDRVVYLYHHLFVDAIRSGRFDADFDGELEESLPEIQGTIDWLGAQYYFRAGVTGADGIVPVLELTPCFGAFDFGACVPPLDPSYCVPEMLYEHHPAGLHHVLADFGARWPDLPLVVTESGIATEVGERRAEVVVRALEQIGRARAEGIDVRGYYHWSLFDNFEWLEGFGPRFGLHRVDYETYERTPTLGADVLGEIARARMLTSAQRARHGGDGPMTPEDPAAEPSTLCNGR